MILFATVVTYVLAVLCNVIRAWCLRHQRWFGTLLGIFCYIYCIISIDVWNTLSRPMMVVVIMSTAFLSIPVDVWLERIYCMIYHLRSMSDNIRLSADDVENAMRDADMYQKYPTVFTDTFKENYKVLASQHIKVGYLFGKFMVIKSTCSRDVRKILIKFCSYDDTRFYALTKDELRNACNAISEKYRRV